MSQKGVLIRRASVQLPAELVNRRSDLDVLITLAGDGVDNRTYGFESTVRVARRVLRQNCSSYRPSQDHPNDVLCGSGEKDGEPVLGSTCFKCRVSQFSQNGFFTGEVINAFNSEPKLAI